MTKYISLAQPIFHSFLHLGCSLKDGKQGGCVWLPRPFAHRCSFECCSLGVDKPKADHTLFSVIAALEQGDLGGSSCMVKMCPKLPLHGTAKK